MNYWELMAAAADRFGVGEYHVKTDGRGEKWICRGILALWKIHCTDGLYSFAE